MKNEILLAIPFFTFMGLVLERSGMAEDLLDTIGQLFGGVRGGLAYAVIFVGALLAATTGAVAASVIAMGLISLPIMLRYGHDRALASGVIAAAGTLAQIIPPSLVLIVMADKGRRYVQGRWFIPGLVLTGLYVGWVFPNTIFRPSRSGLAAGGLYSARLETVPAGDRSDGSTSSADLLGAGQHLHRLGHTDGGRALGGVGALGLC